MTLYVPVQEKNREPRESEKAFTHTHLYTERQRIEWDEEKKI